MLKVTLLMLELNGCVDWRGVPSYGRYIVAASPCVPQSVVGPPSSPPNS